jgi:hypothetical protein
MALIVLSVAKELICRAGIRNNAALGIEGKGGETKQPKGERFPTRLYSASRRRFPFVAHRSLSLNAQGGVGRDR